MVLYICSRTLPRSADTDTSPVSGRYLGRACCATLQRGAAAKPCGDAHPVDRSGETAGGVRDRLCARVGVSERVHVCAGVCVCVCMPVSACGFQPD